MDSNGLSYLLIVIFAFPFLWAFITLLAYLNILRFNTSGTFSLRFYLFLGIRVYIFVIIACILLALLVQAGDGLGIRWGNVFIFSLILAAILALCGFVSYKHGLRTDGREFTPSPQLYAIVVITIWLAMMTYAIVTLFNPQTPYWAEGINWDAIYGVD